MSAALILVDVQNDFCPGGTLAVPTGDRVVPPLNLLASRFAAAGAPVIATRDWHPVQTSHFASSGGLWPDHCVAGTPGADFHPGLKLPAGTLVVSKGKGASEDAYSGFDAVDEAGSPLAQLLRERGVATLYIGGLATDYCVRATVLDALREGFAVVVVEDGIAGVELREGDSADALAAMQEGGARLLMSETILAGMGEPPPAP